MSLCVVLCGIIRLVAGVTPLRKVLVVVISGKCIVFLAYFISVFMSICNIVIFIFCFVFLSFFR